MSNRVLILGASVRSAAQSAHRIGLQVWSADLFADLDLQRCSQAIRVVRYPRGLLRIANSLPPGPWMYTGGLENHPRLVDRIAAQRTLWGNGGSVLQSIRNPLQLHRALVGHGLAAPQWSSQCPLLTGDQWVRKPLRSCGGLHVRLAVAGEVTRQCRTGIFYQQYVRGQSQSGLYLAAGGHAVLLGVTQQLLDNDWSDHGLNEHPFRYCGSIGPLALDDQLRREYLRIGQCLASQFPLRGLFGVDTVVDGERVWTIEVNPRYPASAELIEWALDRSVVGFHVHACATGELDDSLPADANGTSLSQPAVSYGKLVVYAPHELTVGQHGLSGGERVGSELRSGDVVGGQRDTPWLADIPAPGTVIGRDHPICTVLCQGDNVEQVRQRLAAGRLAVLRSSWLDQGQ